MTKNNCEHKQFEAKVNVIRLEDNKRFMAEVYVKCIECDTPFQFIGMDIGLAFDKPMIEVDGLEARLPIVPLGEIPHPLGRKFIKGFIIKNNLANQ